MGPTEKLARFVVDTRLDNIPSHVVEQAKNLILNCLGAILAGSTEKTGKIGIDLVKQAGGEAQSTVVGGGFRTSTILAALANGISAHTTDQDDTDWRILSHPTVAILPAVLALGEYRHAPGKQILESYILGVEAEGKVGLSISPMHWPTGFHGTGVFGHVGATVGCCKLLDLGVEETEIALGIMGSLASGLRHNVGSMSKPLLAGNAAQNGIIAAMLAQRKFTSVKGVLEGRFGFVRAFGGPDAQPERAVEELGKPFVIESPGIVIKGNPCGTYGSVLVEGLQAMVREYGFSSGQVAGIELGTNPEVPRLMRYIYPRDSLEAKYSVPFVVAVTLLDGEAGLKQFTDEKTEDPKVKELISKIRLYDHPDLPVSPDPTKITGAQLSKTHIAVRLDDGREYSRWAEYAKGYVDQPLTREEIMERYRSFASTVLQTPDIEKTTEMVKSLETIKDIAELMGLLP